MRLRRTGQDDTVSIAGARQRFLERYAQELPGLMGELWEKVFPYYEPGPVGYELWAVVIHQSPALRDALSDWARRFLLTHAGQPADWAMDAALETLSKWRVHSEREDRPYVCLKWHHPVSIHEEFPAGDEELYSAATGQPEPEAFAPAFSLLVEVTPWNRPKGESERDFRDRFYAECDRVYEEHIRACKEWTTRRAIYEPRHIDGLAMWQAGRTFSEIRQSLNFNLGGSPKDPDYNSAIGKGLDRIARLLPLDRRAA